MTFTKLSSTPAIPKIFVTVEPGFMSAGWRRRRERWTSPDWAEDVYPDGLF